MFGADKGSRDSSAHKNGRGLCIALVQSRFNDNVTSALAAACRQELLALGVADKDITHVTVPGALEIGSALQALAETDAHDALIALGCIIRGETYHFELVANESGAALTRLALDYQIPIVNAILTTENLAQAEARLDKGREAAQVAVEMALLLDELS